MAEGFCRAFYEDEIDVYSAGSDPQEMDQKTIDMDAMGMDISKTNIKHFNGLFRQRN